MQTFYSQQGEDLFVFTNFINQKREDGWYLELGALDGVTYSNTKFFQDQLGFKGVLIEPLPNTYEDLIRNRPNDKAYNVAISSSKEPVSFVGTWATAGMTSVMAESFKEAHHAKGEEYQVTSRPLGELLTEAGVPYLDLFCLDVEGGELEVLKTMDWTIPVYVLCVELDGHNEEKDEACREVLRNNGFVFEHRICINEFWRNPTYHRKSFLFVSNQKPEEQRHLCMEPHCVPEIKEGLKTYAQK